MSPANQFDLGLSLLRVGKNNEAITCFETALKLDTNNIKVAYILRLLTDKKMGSPPNEFIKLINNYNAEYFERSMEMMGSQIPQNSLDCLR